MATLLLVKEIFRSLQGEGPYVGCPAVFVRLATCNLDCPQCDTAFRDEPETMSVEEVVGRVLDLISPNRLVVITGGEPMVQPISELVSSLLASCSVQIETNGTVGNIGLPYGNPHLTIVCSPKTDRLSPGLVEHIDAYKYVVEAGHISPVDGLPSKSFSGEVHEPARPPRRMPKQRIYLQPCDMKDPQRNRENQDAAITACLMFGYTLCLQVHKILDMP